MLAGMYRDNSLVPAEAIRLTALGLLAGGDLRYDALAAAVRRTIAQLAGPSLDLMGPSLELLRFEGLVRPVDGSGERALLSLTDEGRQALEALLCANVRPQVTDFNRLVIGLKLRFLPLLPAGRRRDQLEMMEDLYRAEVARLSALRDGPEGAEGLLGPWLDLEIAAARARIDWCLAAQAAL
ncbi:MAG: hypothetical protein OHK0024_05460 [Thalassobaculales bacterium]